MQKCVIAVLGGDERMNFAARKLAQLGYSVREWGRREGENAASFAKSAREWFSDVDVLMLPLPTSLDGTHLATPLLKESEGLRMEILFGAAPDKVWLVGRFGESLQKRADREGIVWIDYFESEILQLKNALPTAEGAIEIAMRELPVVLEGCKIAVVGYGRIGEVLSHKLKFLGANVSVYARRHEVCARAELLGHPSHYMAGDIPLQFDRDTRLVLNTVPSRLFTHSVLERLPRDCIIIDLASAPGGVDMIAAEALGIRTIWATALPGKCAPESAGIILGETIHSIILDASWRSI